MSSAYEIGVVYQSIERADAAAVQKLGTLGVASIHESMSKQGLMHPRIRPVYPGARLCGTAVTVLLQPGDNWMLHVAAEQIQPGDVVVAGCVDDSYSGFFGDLLATSYQARGANGLVIDGGVRDADTLEAMDFPVFSRAIHAQGTAKHTLGSINIPVVCGGALVHPGDVVVADADGVVVVPRARAAQVADKAEQREANEEAKRELFASGVLGLDHYKMRDKLVEAGLKYVD